MKAGAHKGGRPLPALRIGPTTDPEIAALLIELRDEFKSRGIRNTTPEEVLRQAVAFGKRPAGTIMVPPRDYWPHLFDVLTLAWNPIRDAVGAPLRIRNGYREPAYNAAVGGAAGSRHQWADALDIYPIGDVTPSQLKLAGARLYADGSHALKMGLSTYVGSIHVDVGWDSPSRPWLGNDAAEWVKKAKAVA